MAQPTPPARTDSLIETRRAQIIAAAASVFAEKGYQRATIKEIAGRAGLAAGTIYLYFSNKRELLLGIADSLIRDAMRQTFLQAAPLEVEAFIAAVLHDRLSFARQNRALLQAIMTEIWTDQELQARFLTQIIMPLFASGAQYVQAGIAAGELRPCRTEIVVPALAGSIVLLAAVRALAPVDFLAGSSEEEIIGELTQLFLAGLRPDPLSLRSSDFSRSPDADDQQRPKSLLPASESGEEGV